MDEKTYLEQLEKRWRKNWPPDIPREIEYPLGEVPVTEYLSERARLDPDGVAYIFYGYEMTFAQLDDLSSRCAAFLASRGAVKGDRVAVFMANCPQFLVAFYGILKLGCIHVPVNPLFKDHEFVYEINDAEPKIIFALDLLFPLVQSSLDKTPLETVVVTSMSEFLPAEPTISVPDMVGLPPVECPGTLDMTTVLNAQGTDYPQNRVGLDDIAALNYTGGTTGMPKGCEHTQRDMLYKAAGITTIRSAIAAPDDVFLTFLPIFWIAGENGGVLLPIVGGRTTVLLTRYDPVAVMQGIDRYKVTMLVGLMDNIVEIMEHPDRERYELSSLRVTQTVSFVKKLNVDYRRRWQSLTGSEIYEASWGMTETHTSDTFTAGLQEGDLDLKSRPIFVGLPVPGTRFKIVDFDDGTLKALGEEGELVVRTPALMKSYWKKPEVFEQQVDNGWFRTGDIGMLDEDGFLHYLGRYKEMIKVKGMSVFPSEIETLLGRHPSIAGSGVLGREDEDKGQVPVAFVMLKPGERNRIGAPDLTAWCRDNMATYKVPEIRIVDQLPMTATGKVIKEELKSRL